MICYRVKRRGELKLRRTWHSSSLCRKLLPGRKKRRCKFQAIWEVVLIHAVIHATTATESSSAPLPLESLHEAIQQIAARQVSLLDTGSEITTITESHFKSHFGEVVLSSANWVWLTAANGIDSPIIGCLEADIECMGKTLHGMCVFVIKESESSVTELKGLPGIDGINVLSDLKNLFMVTE